MRAGRNLLGRLLARKPADVRAIADCWDVPLGGQTHADNVGRLYSVMRDIWAVRDRAAAFDTAQRAVVDALLAAGDAALTVAELASATGLPQPAVDAAVSALDRCGVLHRAPRAASSGTEPAPAYFLARELATGFVRVREEQLLGTALRPDAPLRALLTTLDPAELEEAAAVWGLRVTPGVLEREALTDELLARVDLPEQRRAVVKELDGPAARVFATLREAGEPLAVERLRAALRLTVPALREAGRALGDRLLVWHAYVDGERVLFIPKDVLAPRRPARDAPPPLTPVEALPDEHPRHPYAAAWDLLTLLRGLTLGTFAWREGDEERNATHLRRVAPALWTTRAGRPRPGYVPLLLALAHDEGLVRADGDEMRVTGAVEAWRNRSFNEQALILFERWRAASEWLEGASQDELQLINVDWSAMRQAVLEEIRTLRVGEWYDAATLALRIARLRPTLLGGSFSAARAAGSAGTRDEVSAAAVAIALRGGLVALGLLDEELTGQGELALALTEVGAWLLGLRQAFAPPLLGAHPLAVGADFEILLFRPTPRRLWALGAVAELARLDTVSSYRLTEATVGRAMALGLTRDQLVTFLERGSGGPLPPNVEATLNEWTRRHAGVRLRRVVLLHPNQPEHAARLQATLARAGFPLAEALPDGRLLLPLPDDQPGDDLLATLRAAGFTVSWIR